MIISFPKRLVELALISARSRGTGLGEKFKAFSVLLSLELRAFLNRRSGTLVHKKINGFKVFGYRYKTLQWLYNEVFIKKEYNFLYQGKDPVIMDCGSNIGFAILFLKQKYPEARIFAFEPNPHAYDVLRKNILENDIKGVSCMNIGLANTRSMLDFYISEKGSLMGSITESRGGGRKIQVKVEKLSDYFKEHNPTLVKMDIEGAENLVIADLVQENVLNIPKEYIIEFHHNIDNGYKMSGFLKPFEDAGYEYNLKTDYNMAADFQDVLIHFYKK